MIEVELVELKVKWHFYDYYDVITQHQQDKAYNGPQNILFIGS